MFYFLDSMLIYVVIHHPMFQTLENSFYSSKVHI